MVGGKFGEMEVGDGLDIAGRKLGDVAKESARLEGAVARRATKFGDVEPMVGGAVSSLEETLGHTASAPCSTWS